MSDERIARLEAENADLKSGIAGLESCYKALNAERASLREELWAKAT